VLRTRTRNALPHTKPLLSSCLLFKNHTALCGVAFVSRLSISEGLHNLQVYLDSQHVDWMSDQILRKVVADLRPKWESPVVHANVWANIFILASAPS
jgi:hypothetical protein